MDIKNWKQSPKIQEAKEKLEDEKVRGFMRWVFEIIVTLVLAAMVGIMLFQTVTMQESSMEPTIAVGDRFFINRVVYKFSSPKRGDLIVFRTNASDDAALHIRRVIGLPGETVDIRDGYIYIDGADTPLDEDYLKEDWTVATGNYHFEVPEDSYLMLGDNRNDSWDARYWTNPYVREDKILGKAAVIYWPVHDIGKLE